MIRCPRFLVVSGQLSEFSFFRFFVLFGIFPLCMHTCSLYLIYMLHVFAPYRYNTCHLFLCLNSTRAPCLSGGEGGGETIVSSPDPSARIAPPPTTRTCPDYLDWAIGNPCKRPPTHHDPPRKTIFQPTWRYPASRKSRVDASPARQPSQASLCNHGLAQWLPIGRVQSGLFEPTHEAKPHLRRGGGKAIHFYGI